MKSTLTTLLATLCLSGAALAQTQTQPQSGTSNDNTQSGTAAQSNPQVGSNGLVTPRPADNSRGSKNKIARNNSKRGNTDPNGCRGNDGRGDAQGSGNGRSGSTANAVDTSRTRSGDSPCEDSDQAHRR
jgi:hypothetical protein